MKADGAISPSLLTEMREELANSSLPFKVDLIDWHRISDEFRAEILKQHYRLK